MNGVERAIVRTQVAIARLSLTVFGDQVKVNMMGCEVQVEMIKKSSRRPRARIKKEKQMKVLQ